MGLDTGFNWKRLVKGLVLWNVALTALFLVAMALYASSAQAADDPPVRVYGAALGDVGAAGDGTTLDNLIQLTAPDLLTAVDTPNLSNKHPHTCVVTASASAKHTATSGIYIFGLNVDTIASTVAVADRRIEMFDNADINDDNYEEVTTTWRFENISGDHTFFFTARKSLASDGNMTVDAATMTVVCMKKDISVH